MPEAAKEEESTTPVLASEPESEPETMTPELEEAHMACSIDVNNARFNDPGHYFLHISVCSSRDDKDYSDVMVEKNHDETYKRSHEGTTDTASGDESPTHLKFKDPQWTFYLPKGNCVMTNLDITVGNSQLLMYANG